MERSRCFSFIVTVVIGLPEAGLPAILVHGKEAEDDAIVRATAILCARGECVLYVQLNAQKTVELHSGWVVWQDAREASS